MTTAANPFSKTLPISNTCSATSLHIPSIFNLKSLFLSISWKPNKLPLSLSLSSPQISSFSLQKPTLSSRLISCVSQASGWGQEGPSAVLDEQGSDPDGTNWGAQDFGVGDSEGEVSDVGPEDDGEGFREPPGNAKLYVGNLPFDVDGEKLARTFEGAGIVEVAEVICRRNTGYSQIFGYVTMSTIEEAEKAMEMFNNYELNGRMLIVEKAVPRGSRPPPELRPRSRIYVGNLSWDVDSDRLNEVFSEHGKVLSAYVVLDGETGRSRGFGFVNMASEAEMNDAISALDGQIESRGVVELSRAQAWALEPGLITDEPGLGVARSLPTFRGLRSGLFSVAHCLARA
ncbi:hypothetical protein Cgig2_015719 [Carnegiea gigantea]|uniref:RRM domain-containing protein n=1 Tax=Carnegiea gigantea TaxID=171969 RepID=A0A9Q1JR72_9CARY|nr:hypothetical protein Cgig2_015719 [Carnegiea gigantea]